MVSLLREVGLIALVGLVAYLGLCLLTYSASDPGPTHTGSGGPIQNMGGRVGAWFADLGPEGSGGTAADSGPLGLDGVITGATWTTKFGSSRKISMPS